MKIAQAFALIFAACVVTACGGGGGGSTDTTVNSSNSEQKDFTLSLDSINITRRSNGDTIMVDTTNVSSENLTYSP